MLRQEIVTAIVEKMKEISTANGFYSDAGKNVFEWLDKSLGKDEYPAIIIRDITDNTADGQYIDHKLKIEIDIAVKDGSNTTWNMREVSSDVIKSFGLFEEEINYRCNYNGSDFLVDQKDTLYGGVRLDFEVLYQTGRWEQ
ncbi:hypothetical protein ACOTV5_02395 [Aliarcobacter butzleri]|uniref:hypothetical protein n=1 Tax=Aliarcobacter butzleri TaxID=28197 RepID=UPI003AFA025B